MIHWPRVTVIMPVRNEGRFIVQSLAAVLSQEYPADRLQIIVVDGMSTDETRDTVRAMIDQDRFPQPADTPRVQLLDNPERVVPTALNRGLEHATGEVVIRVDGHCAIAPDYVRRSVEILAETDADCVGGPMKTTGDTWLARGIALALSHPFGVGNAAFRTRSQRSGFVDTVAFGAYRRDVFDRIGRFDPDLVRNQDDEFNFRLIQAGGRIWLDPRIRLTYFSRRSLRGLQRQYYEYGFYKVRLIQKRGGIAAWRHIVAPAFVLGLVATLVVASVTGRLVWLGTVIVPYALVNVTASAFSSRRHGWQYMPILVSAFASIHVAYGLGFLVGLAVAAKRRLGLDRASAATEHVVS